MTDTTDPMFRIWNAMIARTGKNARPPLIWRTYEANGAAMSVPEFVAGHGEVFPLKGRCRGLGPIGDDLGDNEDPIGIWDEDGRWRGIRVDLEARQESPSFWIAGVPYYFPVVECISMHDLLDPQTGKIRRDVKPTSGLESRFGLIDHNGAYEPGNVQWVFLRQRSTRQ